MSDIFANFSSGLESPAAHAYQVVPSDSDDLAVSCRALSVAVGGSVRVTTVGGDDVTVVIAAGAPFPIRCRKVWASGTDATGIVALY